MKIDFFFPNVQLILLICIFLFSSALYFYTSLKYNGKWERKMGAKQK